MAGQLLEFLATGLVLGFTRDKAERRRLLEESDRIWLSLDRKRLFSALERLKLQGMVNFIKQSGGIEEAKLTNRGRARVLEYQFRRLKLKNKKRWDGKWRIVLFDIPETKKKIRDGLRRKLKELGFLEFQKSVFIFPYPCRDEINFVINFFNIPEYVYYLEAPIVPDKKFRSRFKL